MIVQAGHTLRVEASSQKRWTLSRLKKAAMKKTLDLTKATETFLKKRNNPDRFQAFRERLVAKADVLCISESKGNILFRTGYRLLFIVQALVSS